MHHLFAQKAAALRVVLSPTCVGMYIFESFLIFFLQLAFFFRSITIDMFLGDIQLSLEVQMIRNVQI